MVRKLNSGEAFPDLRLNLVEGGQVTLPRGVDGKYLIALFYRGHW